MATGAVPLALVAVWWSGILDEGARAGTIVAVCCGRQAGVAQLAAHLSCKQGVRGSSPLVGSLTSIFSSGPVTVVCQPTALPTAFKGEAVWIDGFQRGKDSRVDRSAPEIEVEGHRHPRVPELVGDHAR